MPSIIFQPTAADFDHRTAATSQNQAMYRTRISTYMICAHRRTNREHCPDYLLKPKKKYEKLHYDDTLLGFCPRFSHIVLNYRLLRAVYGQTLGIDFTQVWEAIAKEGCGRRVNGSAAERKVGVGLQGTFATGTRDGRDHNERNFNGMDGLELPAITSKKTEGNESADEKLAKEYIHIIRRHPLSTHELV